MKRVSLCLLASLLFCNLLFAGPGDDSLDMSNLKFMDSVENSLHWKSGTVMIGNGIVKLNVPDGFHYLDPKESEYILHDIWGNPSRNDVLGMIFPVGAGPFTDSSFAFVISFEETGYVKDEDADKIDYKELLGEIQSAEAEENKERMKQGYEAIHLLRWAQAPFYDKEKKVLHWAKELQFGVDTVHTLNYDVRVLGRKGVLSLNAIATVDNLPMVKENIDKILAIPQFTDGNRYSDFNSSTDKVAEYGIGALIAGGVLAKTGILAMIGKFLLAAWKFIAIGVVAVIGIVRKFLTGKKNSEVS